jgi:hypothetical protein
MIKTFIGKNVMVINALYDNCTNKLPYKEIL